MKAKTQTKHKGANGFEMALFIPYDSAWTETPYIHSILASLDYSTHYLVFTEIKTPIHATLRFDLRLPNAKTGAPRDESLIDGGIILPSCQKLGKDGVSPSASAQNRRPPRRRRYPSKTAAGSRTSTSATTTADG